MKTLLAIIALALAGCLTEPETIHRDYDVGPECLREDSTTWTDTTEIRHYTCTVGGNP